MNRWAILGPPLTGLSVMKLLIGKGCALDLPDVGAGPYKTASSVHNENKILVTLHNALA